MGAATIFNYVNQFGCEKLEKIVVADMSPYMRNGVWEGGIGQGKWTDEDFFADLDKIFDDAGEFAWNVSKNLINPALKNIPEEIVPVMKNTFGSACDTLTCASLWYSLFRTDQRPAIKKITVPLLYLMPENPLYSTVTTDFIKNNMKNKFYLEKNFPGTTHQILMEQPKLTADAVKNLLKTGKNFSSSLRAYFFLKNFMI